MLIIVEGVDGVGKTTFVNELSDSLRSQGREVKVLHRGPPESDEMLEEYELPLQSYRPSSGLVDRGSTYQDVICDRWHLGELVYAPVLRESEPKLDLPRQLHVELFLQSRGALSLLLVTSPDTVRERLEGRQLIRPDQVELVQGLFLDAAHDSYLTWHLTRPDNRFTVMNVIQRAREREHSAEWLGSYPSYAGPTTPDVVLVGDVKNQNHDDRWEAAFVPLSSSSGHYLLQSLPADIRYGCALVNANDEDNLEDLFDRLHYSKVVALGKEAHVKLNSLEGCVVDHGSVPHPQFVRRFHHHKQHEYGQAIRNAALFEEDLLSWRP